MPTPLKLDLSTEHQLCQVLGETCHLDHFTLRDGAQLSLSELKPKEKSLVDSLKSKFGSIVDFESGGLKLYEFDYNGTKGTFSVVPRWDSTPDKSKSGPGVMLQFHMRF